MALIRVMALLFMAPVFVLQGRQVRARTPILPEPDGVREGQIGRGPDQRLLILGDSAAAGVGVSVQDEALSGRLVEALAPHFRLQWRLEARNGRRAGDVLAGAGLPSQGTFDTIVISLGVNDVTAGTPIWFWINQMETLLDRLRKDYGARYILVTAVPPMDHFPALPQPLRWYLGARAAAMNRGLARRLSVSADVELVEVPFSEAPDVMAEDGFHPGPAGYRDWARTLAERIRARFGSVMG